jgi:hypothetical protein
MRNSGGSWGTELLVVFLGGFLLAGLLAAGGWYLVLQPRHEAALRTKEAALKEKEAALIHCTAAKDQCHELREKLQAENSEINSKLEDALRGWGRCLRSQGAAGPGP